MDGNVALLQKYTRAFKDMVNEKIRVSDDSVKKLLRLTKKEDWAFFCTAMEIVDDASFAVDNFLTYDLGGPTKLDGLGERYLRLYGVLNATYVQQQALVKLYKLNNAPNPEEFKQKIDSLVIRALRHKLAAHAIDYRNPKTSAIETYVPMRATLTGFNCEFINKESQKIEGVDLKAATEAHLSLMIEIADRIFEKAIGTFFKGYQKREEQARKRLDELRVEKQGHIPSLNGQPSIVVTFMSGQIQHEHTEGHS